MQRSRCTVLSGSMGDASRFMKPVNVFPSVETILHCLGWMRQSLVAYCRLPMLQLISPSNPGRTRAGRIRRLPRAIATTCCLLMAANASALPAQEPNAVGDIRSVLQSQQEAWNRGDIDGFRMDTRAQHPLFSCRKIRSNVVGKMCASAIAKNTRIAPRWAR